MGDLRPPRYHGVALTLLLFGVAAHFAWHAAPVELQADTWNASGALFVLLLLALLASAYGSRDVWAVCLLLGLWQLMVAGCSLLFMLAPWPVQPGQAQCSARLDFPVGLLSAWLASLLAVRMWR